MADCQTRCKQLGGGVNVERSISPAIYSAHLQCLLRVDYTHPYDDTLNYTYDYSSLSP